jgi:hypothetical protein
MAGCTSSAAVGLEIGVIYLGDYNSDRFNIASLRADDGQTRN